MSFGCLSLLRHILSAVFADNDSEFSPENTVHLPDDVLIDILSGLPAESLLRGLKACKRWRSLTSSPIFTRLYVQRATPIIFMLAKNLLEGPSLYLYDHTARDKSKIQKLNVNLNVTFGEDYGVIVSSCGGFILFDSYRRFYFLNPLTGEHVCVYRPSQRGFIWGFFYHSRRNEFKVLYEDLTTLHCYYSYILGADDWRKIKRSFPPYLIHPSKKIPAVCDGFLHWIACDTEDRNHNPPCSCKILVFEMDTEEFSVIPLPAGNALQEESNHETMNLLVKDDQLAFCSWNRFRGVIDIWIMEGYETRFWVQKWRLDLCLPWRPAFVDSLKEQPVKLMQIQNGELWLDCPETGIYVYNLNRNTVISLGGSSKKNPFAGLKTPYDRHTYIPYDRSHLSLPIPKRSLRVPPF